MLTCCTPREVQGVALAQLASEIDLMCVLLVGVNAWNMHVHPLDAYMKCMQCMSHACTLHVQSLDVHPFNVHEMYNHCTYYVHEMYIVYTFNVLHTFIYIHYTQNVC